MESNFEKAPQIKIKLQRMTLDDIDAYLALEKKVETRTYTAAQNPEEAEEELAQGPMYFITQGNTVLGAVSYSLKEDGSAYINGLSIDPEYQGQGLGRKALEIVLEEVKDVPRVWLVTHPENERAIALYKSFNFEIGERIENFHGDGEPRIVLSRDQATRPD